MTDFSAEASDTDLADQAQPIDGDNDEVDSFGVDDVVDAEADAADLMEQRRSVPSDDDDYPVE